MPLAISLLLVLAVLLPGCGTPRAGAGDPGQLLVQLRFEKKDGLLLEQPARVYADGKLAGECWEPGELVVDLPKGAHTISLEIPWAWQLSKEASRRAIALKGEQAIEMAGHGKQQVLLFERKQLRKKTLLE